MPRLLSTTEIIELRAARHPEFHDDSCELCAMFNTMGAMVALLDVRRVAAYSDDEPRDDGGRWTSGGGDGGSGDEDTPLTIKPISGGPDSGSIVSFDKDGNPIGKSGKPLAVVSTDTSLSSLPEDKQKASVDNLKTYGGITPQQATDHLVQVYDASDPNDREKSSEWYQNAHDLAKGTGIGYQNKIGGTKDNPVLRPDSEINDAVKKSGLSAERMAAVIAVLSPQSQWSANISAAYAVADITAHPERTLTEADAEKLSGYKNPGAGKFEAGMTYGDITSGKYDSKDRQGAMAAVLAVGKYPSVSPGGSGYGKIETAFAIANGADIDTSVTGVKVRSFFNNINNNGGGNDVTIDSHMVEAAVGGRGDPDALKSMADLYLPVSKAGQAKYDAWQAGGEKGKIPRFETVGGRIVGGSPSYAGATIAAYPVLADAVRNAAAFVNDRDGTSYSPAEFQAITWVQQLKDYPDGVSGR
jgi:hypothetical protein